MSIYSELSSVLSPEVIEKWLLAKGTTTWGGRGWSVVDPKELPDAVEWFVSEMEDLISFAAVNSLV